VRIAVTGARGQLGAAIAEEFSAPGRGHDVVSLFRTDLDVTDDAAVAATIERLRPDVIVNCAAYNAVDAAEDHPVEALNSNAFAVRALARAATRVNGALVHYSTDFVFDGSAASPHVETDTPSPRGAYAVSKLLGEWFALDAPRAYVLRVESLFGRAAGGRPAKGSVAAILNTLRAGGEVKVFEDRTVSPTYVRDAASATRQLIEQQAAPGLYHCVNSGHCTWLEFARELARRIGAQDIDTRLIPIRVEDMKLRAARPKYCALSNAKLASCGIVMPTWQDALARYLDTAPA
jgi:dTDP-4-dehydrorhamnose reductase